MSPQGGSHPAAAMQGYQPNHQSPAAGPSPGRTYGHGQGGFPPTGYPPQGYTQMAGSAGGYGHDQNPASSWGTQPSAHGFPRNPPNGGNNFGGY